MNRTAPVLLLASLIIHSTSSLVALAGGAVSAGVAPSSKAAAALSPRPVPETRGLPAN